MMTGDNTGEDLLTVAWTREGLAGIGGGAEGRILEILVEG